MSRKKLWPTPRNQDGKHAAPTQWEQDNRPQDYLLHTAVNSQPEELPEQTSQLTLLPEDSLASLSVLPGSAKARKMTVTSGLKCFGSYGTSGPLGSLQRMLLGSSTWGSTIVWLTWRVVAMKSRRFRFQLVPSTPRTDGIESSLLHTPTGVANQLSPSMATRDAGSWGLLPTPTQFDATAGDLAGKEYQEGVNHAVKLGQAVQWWPTMTANAAKNNSEGINWQKRLEHRHLDGVMHQAEGSGSLNPTWVEWLMGFPSGWTDLEPSETP